MMVFFGFLITLMGWFMPYGYEMLGFMFWAVGLMIAFFGCFLVFNRAHKTGVYHFLDPARPGDIKWFYVYPDGSVIITPSMREVESSLYSKELDALIKDFKSYKLFDHSVRFVPAGVGHAVDLDLCLYAHMLKGKWGFNNLREARKGFKLFGTPKYQDIKQQEKVTTGQQLDAVRG